MAKSGQKGMRACSSGVLEITAGPMAVVKVTNQPTCSGGDCTSHRTQPEFLPSDLALQDWVTGVNLRKAESLPSHLAGVIV